MKLSEKDLKDCINGCKNNNRTSQRKIYEYLYSPMMIVCLRYASDKQEASDILQDAFLKVFDKIGLYNDDGSFEGWVRRIIVNTSIDAIRKKKKEILTEDTSLYQDVKLEEDDITTPYDNIEINDVVLAMQNLSPVYQAVFNMYVMDGMTHQEIANKLEISVGTSKSNLSKARQKIKKLLIEKLQSNEQ